MKLNVNLKKKIQRFCLVLICLVVLNFQSDFPNLQALPMDNYQDEMVIEELRLKVPAEVRVAWLNAEKEIWEPWLSSQDGFLGRQLFWDKEKEEALILVNWESKKLWKSIPMSEVNVVQQKFENNVKAALNVGENPFELIYEGELDKQR
ncbi:MAG: TIGR03792 family protein [Prochlorococcus marinus CUG1439]|uniref:TIGR03792 family protein n=1 Tax=Prochlorococcus sp. MIT 1314 TaxID=3096220 RepID=UPI001B03F56F|nr:TIGR03792 family protein [Prochlorococcus sp. MIT 1314]MCR8538842.1 TIGR03792 family protein [Prochlorococcus marinus CUG1439]